MTKYYAFARVNPYNHKCETKLRAEWIDCEEVYLTEEEATEAAKQYLREYCDVEDEGVILFEVEPKRTMKMVIDIRGEEYKE